jgi:hypothetical protein
MHENLNAHILKPRYWVLDKYTKLFIASLFAMKNGCKQLEIVR